MGEISQIIRTNESVDRFMQGNPVSVRFSYPDKTVVGSINAFLSRLLAQMDLLFLHETLVTILRECILNAAKANSKRLFFQKNSHDINNPASYAKLMRLFKEKVVGDMTIIESDLRASDYYVDLRLQKMPEGVRIRIENNCPIHAAEEIRIKERIENAKKIKDFGEAYDNLYDETEGAGLGIILTILLLRNSGITADHFTITSDGSKTETSLLIPYSTKSDETVRTIKTEILNEIHLLPSIPAFISELLVLCDDPESSISMMAEKVKSDPALTADILKLANSAGFASMKKIENINEALMRVGLSNFKYILLAATTRRILDQRYKKFEQIWQHSLKVAFYARQIALTYKLGSMVEQIFITALLHDLGKLVLLAVDSDLTIKIADFVKNHGIRTTTILEEIAIGISHSTIGKLISEKWNFAEFITEGIAHHHAPLLADEKYRDIVLTVYMANILAGIEDRKYDYFFLESGVLQRFQIADDGKIQELHEKLKEAFQNRPSL